MYFKNMKELRAFHPIENGVWNKEFLKEYLIQSCNRNFTEFIDKFMMKYPKDETLVDLLIDFLLNDDYDGSDSQIGAAKYIARMDKGLLRRKKTCSYRRKKTKFTGNGHFVMMN